MTATLESPRAAKPSAASKLADRQIVRPLPGDTQPQFAIRFHANMQRLIPSTSERQRLCQQVWRASENGDHAVEDMAAQRFADANTVRDVCEFGEHTLKLPGKVEKYDLRSLASIVENCNRRIKDSGDYGCLCDDHTPPDEALQAGAKLPRVLGHLGPYFLGQIGEESPRWAIFADEHWLPEAFPERAQYSRRSAELFRFDERGRWIETPDRFIDPVAALGSKTPALNLGTVQYSATSRRVCYSGEALPSSTNCFVAGDDAVGKKAKYDENVGEPAMQLDPETIQQVASVCVQAIMQSAPMQWVISQMPADGQDPNAAPGGASGAAPTAPNAAPGDAMAGDDPNAALTDDSNTAPAGGDGDTDPAPMGDQPAAPAAPPTDAPADAAPPASPPTDAPAAPAADATPAPDASGGDAEQAFVATLTPQQKAMYDALSGKGASGSGAAQYSLVSQFNNQLREQNEALAKQVATASKIADNAHFEGTLSVLKYRDGYQFDEADVLKKCAQYSRQQFDELVGIIKAHSPRVPLANVVAPFPTPDITPPATNDNDAKLAERAVRYCRQQKQTNPRYTFEDALAHVRANAQA